MGDKYDYMVLFGLDGVVDSDSETRYTYKQFVVDCFKSVFPMHNISDNTIITRSREWSYSNKYRILIKEKASYEEILLYYLEWVINDEAGVTEYLYNSFIKETKVLFSKLTLYYDIIEYIEKLRNACSVGIITDRDWLGCSIISSFITDDMFDYSQHYWNTDGIFKNDKQAWKIAEINSGKKRDNILVVDTHKNIIDMVVDLGFHGYLHTEGDLLNLSKEVNKFLSNRGV